LSGHPIGQSHHKARLTDAQVRQMRQLRQDFGLTYKKLAERFKCGESTARDIVNYCTRYSA